jgi:uncharacterized protein (DUF362 family)
MAGELNRRRFLRQAGVYGAGLASGWPALAGSLLAPGCSRHSRAASEGPDLVVIEGEQPARNCQAAIDALGGMSRFVRPGERVVIKPNPVGHSRPELAINTHPEMVACTVRNCLRSGAAEVIVASHDSRRSMVANGIAAAVEGAGGRLEILETMDQFHEVPIPRGHLLGREWIARSLTEADVFINMPIAKHHAATEVTFTMKNLMGVNWDRIRFHRTDLQRSIAELAGAIPHSLIIMDANHVLLSNGPAGPGEVLRARTVIAGTDPVAVDAYTLRYFGRTPQSVGHIRLAYELGVGEIDLARLRIREYSA